MYEISDTQLAVFLQQYLLPFVRIGALLMAMPVIGTRIVPARTRILSAFLITLIVVPLLPPIQSVAPLSLAMVIAVIQEIALGVAIGFTFQVAFQVFVLGGQLVAMKMGLGFASMNDPANGVQTTVLSQFFLMLVTLMFISVNGHLILIETLCLSFETLPINQHLFGAASAHKVAELGGWLFASALIFSLPVLTAILVVNIAFGVMSRAAPQLNIFAVGFPFTLVCGLFLLWLGLKGLSVQFESIFDYGHSQAKEMLQVN